MNKKIQEITGIIEDWYITGEGEYKLCYGKLYNDIRKRWKDGEDIHTSTILSNTDNLKEGDTIITKNSKYKLGKPYKS
jgi:hypothetical protein